MCGIAGVVSRHEQRTIQTRRMLDVLAHRGPDGEGIREHEEAVLGHRRLAIIDPEGGAQPLVNEQGTIALVCNGEIYNYRSLRAELVSRGYRFRTGSDCEVILGLYELYGDRLLERLRGMFAFALWDASRRRLLAARDHFGQKPFYYFVEGSTFAFASELKALVAFDPGLRELDLAALDQYLALRLIASPRTMFRRIRKLPPGHKLIFEPGAGCRVSPYWRLTYQPKLTWSEERLIDELDERLTEVLRLHMVSDVEVGALLSGGMDSSLIVAMLAKRVGVKDLPTFTMDLPYRRFSEAPHARVVSQAFGTEHHEERVGLSLADALPDLIWHSDEPSDPLALCTFMLARMVRRRVKVVLGGDGGDELFGGYDRYYGLQYAARYAQLPLFLRRSLISPLISLVPESTWYKSRGHQLRWLEHASLLTGAQRYAASLTYFYFDERMRAQLLSAEAREQLAGFRAESVIEERFDSIDGDLLDRMLYTDAGIRLPDHPVMITDRMAMARGLEVRSPFMDHKLAEFVARIPSDLKVRGRRLRHIQKRLASRYLPESILRRPKQGFSSALPYVLRDEYRELYREVLSDSRLVAAGIFRPQVVQTLLQAHLSGRADHGNRLWLLLNAELWYRMQILGVPREQLRRELGSSHITHTTLAIGNV